MATDLATSDPALERDDATFSEELLGKPAVARLEATLAKLDSDWRMIAGTVLLGMIVLVPYLGAVGLWDCWEPHYGEVAREMIQRNDYVYPFWESDWFFSKPPLTMWMQAVGMQLAGTNRTPLGTPVALYTEWAVRLPFTLLSIGALAMLGLAVKRVANVRAAAVTVFAMATMPMFFLISRESVTDTPMVACITIAVSCAVIALLDPTAKNRTAWWFGFHIFTALTLLAKEMLAAIPPTVLLLYAGFCVIPWDAEGLRAHAEWLSDPAVRAEVRDGKRPMPILWDYMYRMKLLQGLAVFAAVALPWYLVMAAFPETDEEGKTFLQRVYHDNFLRLAAGVHTTTPGGDFTYFIEQGAYAIFPWCALVPGVLGLVSRLKLRGGERTDHLASLAFLWMLLSFALVGFSATKFHHYIYPALPPLSVLIGLYVDKLWEEGTSAHLLALLLGGVVFALVGKDLASNPKNFTDLFVYNYDRAYPVNLVNNPLSFFGMRTLWTGDLLTLLLLAFGAYLAGEAFRGKDRTLSSRAVALALGLGGVALLVAMATRGKQPPTLFLGLAAIVVAVYIFYAANGLTAGAKTNTMSVAGAIGIIGIGMVVAGVRFPANGDPLLAQLMQPVNVKLLLGIAFAVGGGLAMLAAIMRAKTMMFGSFAAFALVFTLWFNWDHWVDLSHQWTQRDLFWRYYRLHKPNEPIAAFQMNWRGETFYSRNQVKQIKEPGRMAAYADQPGREWALVEHYRLNSLKSAVGPNHTVTPVDRDLNVKFVLVSID